MSVGSGGGSGLGCGPISPELSAGPVQVLHALPRYGYAQRHCSDPVTHWSSLPAPEIARSPSPPRWSVPLGRLGRSPFARSPAGAVRSRRPRRAAPVVPALLLRPCSPPPGREGQCSHGEADRVSRPGASAGAPPRPVPVCGALQQGALGGGFVPSRLVRCGTGLSACARGVLSPARSPLTVRRPTVPRSRLRSWCGLLSLPAGSTGT